MHIQPLKMQMNKSVQFFSHLKNIHFEFIPTGGRKNKRKKKNVKDNVLNAQNAH